ncbi:MAG: trehalose-phosphatase [Candidatus Magasanikiibacteriota bacterium]
MKYLFNNLLEIEKKLYLSEGILVMFDFDGTLSPIASTPYKAILPKKIKNRLIKCSKKFPLVVISGRSLKDIKNKVDIKDLVYAGNHGLEWQIGKKINSIPVPKSTTKLLSNIKQKLQKIKQKYPGILIEHKSLSCAIHYRQLNPKLITCFKKDINNIIKPLNNNNVLEVLKEKKVIELKPNIDWDKGKFALFIHEYFQNKLKLKLLPVYVGDDKTDEDVFTALQSGLTIRVGINKKSSATFYIKKQEQIILFIDWLLKQT